MRRIIISVTKQLTDRMNCSTETVSWQLPLPLVLVPSCKVSKIVRQII